MRNNSRKIDNRINPVIYFVGSTLICGIILSVYTNIWYASFFVGWLGGMCLGMILKYIYVERYKKDIKRLEITFMIILQALYIALIFAIPIFFASDIYFVKNIVFSIIVLIAIAILTWFL